jgi:hypothetical protein
MLVLGQELDSKALVKTLKAYSTTKNYAERVNYIIDSIREQEKSVGEITIKTKEDSKSPIITPEKNSKNLTK